jgi:hypothetical protein
MGSSARHGRGFVAGDAERGASIAYFTVFSLAPTLPWSSVAGLVFGATPRRRHRRPVDGLMGRETAESPCRP